MCLYMIIKGVKLVPFTSGGERASGWENRAYEEGGKCGRSSLNLVIIELRIAEA